MIMNRIHKRYLRVLILTFLGWGVSYTVKGQSPDPKDMPYYISLNTSDGTRIHDIYDDVLGLQYHDMYGQWKNIPLKIYDWKRNLVITLDLDKTQGINNFTINLKEIYNGWRLNEIYSCELNDEQGENYMLPIRMVSPSNEKIPVINILVNPLQMKCDDLSQNVVEFYGEIQGGRAPYTISWFVLNENRTDFLYQPREEIISTAGKTTVIRVDKNPDYYVVLYVKDACGHIQEKIVNLVCEDSRKKINTLFVEELNSPLLKNRRIK
jgi:hypothetical protein